MVLFQLLFIETLRGQGFVSFVLCVCMSFCFVLDLFTEYIFTVFATFAYNDTYTIINNKFDHDDDDELMLNVLRCHLTY